jgi:hypothetical protein
MISSKYKEHIHPFLRENGKIIAQFILTVFFISLGIWFIKHESAELVEVKNVLISARWQWLIVGIIITTIYILLQGQMYVFAFASVFIEFTGMANLYVAMIALGFQPSLFDKGLCAYKEKFEPVWHNKYLIYQQDFDLLKVPALLAKVIKP